MTDDFTPNDFVYLPRPVLRPELRAKGVGRLLPPAVMGQVAGHQFQRLLGFWLCWHALGGLDGLLSSGLWSRGGVYEQLRQFREIYELTPDELLPELAQEVKSDAAEWPDRFPIRRHPSEVQRHRR